MSAGALRPRGGTRTPRPRHRRVELHHDGSFVLAVNRSQRTLRDWSRRPTAAAVVNVDVVEQACINLEAIKISNRGCYKPIDNPDAQAAIGGTPVTSHQRLTPPPTPLPRYASWIVLGGRAIDGRAGRRDSRGRRRPWPPA